MRRCSKCGEEKPLDEFVRDARKRDGRGYSCADCHRATNRAYYQSDSYQESASRRGPKLKKVERLPVYNERAAQKKRECRARVIAAYGGTCVCCGESEPKFLAIDHVFNDGAAERKRFKTPSSFYRWLDRNGYPKGRYQLLCHNCNMAKGFYGECPHAREVIPFPKAC